ncbi:hypothetical protein A2955_01300 [Candidatus Woesebacteria bacterium RIFCSPLOWO2_01_FULL_37_19]|uniref:Uncharacterized protein n=2 Tax=Candidatus Woeseibacteriota TaxID=1752722 RepID=A0A1F8B237_9BACT|nr:MAG: hypothetical protein A2771_03490 [Candidatus Woesebacteria bacterium RIFCSPHIGHO2_01_FULL_38_26b]OGM58062.1 MAG: hypothetical protein A2955_01300 [Candidatus Woesebacteria bacterium RIFCSPLOWO2_01_FULL_37_19]
MPSDNSQSQKNQDLNSPNTSTASDDLQVAGTSANNQSVLNPNTSANSDSTTSHTVQAISDQPPNEASKQPEEQIPLVTAPHAPKKYGGNKVIATIFGVVLLIAGVTAGVLLVQRQQELREQAASGQECSQSQSCVLLENPGNNSSYTAPKRISHIFITNQDSFRFDPPGSNNGCYDVKIEGDNLEWDKIATGSDCKDISNIQVWLTDQEISPTPTLTPTPTIPEEATPTPTLPPNATPTPTTPDISAKCSDVKAYDNLWNPLDLADLASLEPGDIVRFAVSGSASSGSFDKARFTINGSLKPEVTTKKPGTQEFYYQYTLPDGVSSFTIKGEIHHSNLGWL